MNEIIYDMKTFRFLVNQVKKKFGGKIVSTMEVHDYLRELRKYVPMGEPLRKVAFCLFSFFKSNRTIPKYCYEVLVYSYSYYRRKDQIVCEAKEWVVYSNIKLKFPNLYGKSREMNQYFQHSICLGICYEKDTVHIKSPLLKLGTIKEVEVLRVTELR